MTAQAVLSAPTGGGNVWHSHVGIPVRNLWLLLVYASDLAAFGNRFDGSVDEAADLPELLARLLTVVVERRLRHNLTRAYEPRAAVLHRVRGRIDWLQTESGMLLQRGEVACRFEDLTHDTPRNRLVRAALEAMAGRVSNPEVATECRGLARHLDLLGVRSTRPSRAEMTRERFGRHDAEDRLMVTVAELALDLVLPSEAAGDFAATRLDRDEKLLRRIFEKAVAGLCRHELHGRSGWTVSPQKPLKWNLTAGSAGFTAWLPGMNADVVLEQQLPTSRRRIVVETKFADALTTGQYGKAMFKNGHLYQLYAYLQTQTGAGDIAADKAEGVLIYPTVGLEIDEWAVIQDHRIRLATVDLAGTSASIRGRLLKLVQGQQGAIH